MEEKGGCLEGASLEVEVRELPLQYMVYMVTAKFPDRKANGIVDQNLGNIFEYVTLTL